MARTGVQRAIGFAIALAAAALAGCPSSSGGGSKGGGADTIRIAVVGPMSGSGAAFGEMIRKAAELKVSEVNAQGGIGGRKVELVVEDDRGDTTEAANVARKLAGDRSISIVIGHFNSTCSNAAKEEYNRKGVVQFSPGSTNVSVCAGSPWTFRNLYRDDYQGTFLAEYAKNVLGAKRVAVIFDNDDYGRGLMEAFRKRAGEIGLEVLPPISYVRERTSDFKPVVGQLAGKPIDALFISGLYNEAALITKVAREELGLTVPILAGDGVMNDKFVEIAGKAAEGVYVTTPFLLDAAKGDPKVEAFRKAFREKYGKDPDTWAALTYDAVGMALEAIRDVGTDREKIRQWFAAHTSAGNAYQGVTGPTWFDADGDCYSKGAHVAVVKNGRFVPAERQYKPQAQ
ncbi:MAG: branched-chain amino acid ABC transporter substrate-binding protein [Planctomycetota bacterium]|nr:MAG: branched-chain amino acid ABC transporter substrate-binding protein [Planctomycetota bacterium]